jgi:hypothetical protein
MLYDDNFQTRGPAPSTGSHLQLHPNLGKYLVSKVRPTRCHNCILRLNMRLCTRCKRSEWEILLYHMRLDSSVWLEVKNLQLFECEPIVNNYVVFSFLFIHLLRKTSIHEI